MIVHAKYSQNCFALCFREIHDQQENDNRVSLKKTSNVKEYFIFVEDEIFNNDLAGVMHEINYVADLLVIDTRS